jgi:hypothetical protein
MRLFHGISQVIGNPFPLKQNAGKSFQGSIVLGKGFVLTVEEAKSLITKDPRNKDVLLPYLNGDDLNNDPEQKPSRWVINFFDWSEAKARSYPDCFGIVERLVKPERMKQKDKGGKEKWWQFLRPRNELYETISKLDQVMTINRYTKYVVFDFQSRDIVFSDSIVVFALDSYNHFAVLSSALHEIWAWKNSSTMGSSTLRYSASNAFETFPFPRVVSESLKEASRQLDELRKTFMKINRMGLTEMYNLFHDNKSTSVDSSILKIRQLHSQIDNLTLEAYGWNDIELQHGFYGVEYLPENDRNRFTINPNARKEILTRLIKLNHQLHFTEASEFKNISRKTAINAKGVNSATLF